MPLRESRRAEIGVSHSQYSEILGEAWVEVEIFLDSSDGKELWELSWTLSKAAADFRKALDDWNQKLRFADENSTCRLRLRFETAGIYSTLFD